MNYILGGGMTGLITSLYFKTFSVLTKGKGQDAEYLGLRVLRRTEVVDEFIKKFVNEKSNRIIKPRIFKVGFFVNSKIITKVSKDLKQMCIEKVKQNDWKVEEDLVDIEGYDMVDVYRTLVNKFDVKTRRVFLNIKKINKNDRIISGVNPIHKQIKIALMYSQLINTLSTVLFNSLIEGEFIKIINSQMYVCIIESDELAKQMENVDFIYYPEKNVPYRITKISSRKFCVESEKVFFPKTDFNFSCRVVKTIQIPFGRMIDKIEPIDVDNVIHLGRNATFEQSFRIDKLIEMLENKEVRI